MLSLPLLPQMTQQMKDRLCGGKKKRFLGPGLLSLEDIDRAPFKHVENFVKDDGEA